YAERADIGQSRATRGQRECWKHAEEVGAAGHAVQDAHAERRVRVTQAAEPRGPAPNVQVVVCDQAMLMRRLLHTCATAERPESDGDECAAHNPLAPCRD